MLCYGLCFILVILLSTPEIIMTINLRKLASVSTQLAHQACFLLKNCLADNLCRTYLKAADEPVTDADFKIQAMLLRGIKMHFPELQIIAEETQQYQGDIEYNYASLQPDMLPKESQINQQLDSKQVCLWIDPIDCTRGFINGNIEDVTVLIGLSYKNKPQFGVIATPYKMTQKVRTFDPVVTIGSVKQKQTYDYSNGAWSKKLKKQVHKPLIVASSNTRKNAEQQNFIRGLKARNLTAGGSGRKIMMVANGEADAMVFIDSVTHKWDSCAGDAIIKSMGGYFSTPWGANITYKSDSANTKNKQGMITAVDRQVYQKCMDVIGIY